jgi:site-specific DNA-cytosine methylase
MNMPKITHLAALRKSKQRGGVHSVDGIVGCCAATDYKEPKYILEPSDTPPKIKVIGSLETTSTEHSNRVHDPDGISPTATAVSGGTHHIKIFDYNRYRVRKLTPIEYGRLQGFDMNNWKQVVSNSQAYKQFGNAVTATVSKAIAKSIAAFLGGKPP